MALPVHLGERVFHRRDDFRDATPDQRLGTGRRLAEMRAGLERDVDRGTARGVAGLRQRIGFGMRTTAVLRAARPTIAVLHDDATHRRIGQVRPSDRRASASAARIMRISP